jgi:sugar phosphate isomerase/epimerase
VLTVADLREDAYRRRYTVSTVCLRQYDFARALEVARELGFDSVDLVGLRGLCEHVPVNGTISDLRAAAKVFRESGLRGASVNADPGSFDGFDDRSDVMRRAERLIGFAEEAEVPLLVLPAGEKAEDRSADPQMAIMQEALNRAAAYATARGVRLAVEAPYFGRPVDTTDRAAALLEGLDPSVRMAFDVSHIEAADESVVEAWGRFASRVAVVHFRDAVSGDIRRVIGHGRVDFAAILSAMEGTGYAGDVVLELETRNSPYASKEEEVRGAVSYLDGA